MYCTFYVLKNPPRCLQQRGCGTIELKVSLIGVVNLGRLTPTKEPFFCYFITSESRHGLKQVSLSIGTALSPFIPCFAVFN